MRHARLLPVAALLALLILAVAGCSASTGSSAGSNNDVTGGLPAMYEFYTDT